MHCKTGSTLKSRIFKIQPCQMKRYAVLSATCLVSFLTVAQNPYYNPDSDGDNFVAVGDLMSLLQVYDTELGIDTTATCDYDGTSFGDWCIALLRGNIVLDSLRYQVQLGGTSTEYVFGCPNPAITPWQVEGTRTMHPFETGYNQVMQDNAFVYEADHNGEPFYFNFRLEGSRSCGGYYANPCLTGNGTCPCFPFQFSGYISVSLEGTYFGGYTNLISGEGYPELDSAFEWGESGLVSTGPFTDGFITYLQILPYWHAAE